MLTLIASSTFTNHLTTWLQSSSENNKNTYLLSFLLNVIQKWKLAQNSYLNCLVTIFSLQILNNKLWRKKINGWELARTKAILIPQSNMKVVWNTCKRKLGRIKPVNPVKTTTNCSFENFQRHLPFTEIHVKF